MDFGARNLTDLQDVSGLSSRSCQNFLNDRRLGFGVILDIRPFFFCQAPFGSFVKIAIPGSLNSVLAKHPRADLLFKADRDRCLCDLDPSWILGADSDGRVLPRWRHALKPGTLSG